MESLHCFFVFERIKLQVGLRGNFRLLISNLNSKTQYEFEILRKCHFSSLGSWFLAQHPLMNWLPWQQWMIYLQSFNFKNFYIWLPKNDISLLKISWTVLRYSAKTFENLPFFQLSHFDDVMKSTWWWRHQNFCQFVKIFTHSIFLPSFIVIWLEIAKLQGGGAKWPPSLCKFAKSPVQIGLSQYRWFLRLMRTRLSKLSAVKAK